MSDTILGSVKAAGSRARLVEDDDMAVMNWCQAPSTVVEIGSLANEDEEEKLLNVDYCVSFTGNAGPTAMEGKPVGLIYIGIAIYDKVEVYEFHLSGDRDTIQNEGVNNALKLLEQKILENN